ncbi:MAG TPA: phage tail protein [Rhizomicrobium sp.]|jgi:hypothetical protein
MGGKHTTNAAERISSLQLQSSAYAIPIPVGWGRARVGLNLIWAANFQSQQHAQNQSSGKGGGGSTSVSFTYSADVIFGICDTASGAIRGLNTIFRDKSVFSGTTCVTDAGFSLLAAGEGGQAPWTYLEQTYPAQALGYDTIAYLAASNYALNDQAGLQNHSVEADFALQVGSGIVDANPGYANGIVADFLTNQVPQWSRAYIGDLTVYGDYCLAAGLLLSPVLDTQQQASDFLQEIMTASNAQCWIRGDGTLQVLPLADAAISGNGVSFTPGLTPVYDLTSADFIVDDPADDPISIDTANLDDLYNYVQVQFQNREHQYNDETVPAFDQASIDEIGQRKQDPTDLPSIKDPTVARLVAQLLVQQTSSLARPFTFSLPWCFDLLEEMDVVTVSNEAQGLNRVLCRIQKIDEDGDSGKLTIQANEILVGTANAPVYPSQSANGTITDFEADPGGVAAPVLFIAPTAITNGAFQAWAAVSSTNPNWGGCQVWVSVSNADYKMIGTIAKGARFGTTVSDLPAAADPHGRHADRRPFAECRRAAGRHASRCRCGDDAVLAGRRTDRLSRRDAGGREPVPAGQRRRSLSAPRPLRLGDRGPPGGHRVRAAGQRDLQDRFPLRPDRPDAACEVRKLQHLRPQRAGSGRRDGIHRPAATAGSIAGRCRFAFAAERLGGIAVHGGGVCFRARAGLHLPDLRREPHHPGSHLQHHGSAELHLYRRHGGE